MMFFAMVWGMGSPHSAFQTAVTVSDREMGTLPTHTHRIIASSSAAVNSA